MSAILYLGNSIQVIDSNSKTILNLANATTIKGLVDATENSDAVAYGQVLLLKTQIDALEKKYTDISSKISALEKKDVDISSKIDALEKKDVDISSKLSIMETNINKLYQYFFKKEANSNK